MSNVVLETESYLLSVALLGDVSEISNRIVTSFLSWFVCGCRIGNRAKIARP